LIEVLNDPKIGGGRVTTVIRKPKIYALIKVGTVVANEEMTPTTHRPLKSKFNTIKSRIIVLLF
jgi:hypothetical protein